MQKSSHLANISPRTRKVSLACGHPAGKCHEVEDFTMEGKAPLPKRNTRLPTPHSMFFLLSFSPCLFSSSSSACCHRHTDTQSTDAPHKTQKKTTWPMFRQIFQDAVSLNRVRRSRLILKSPPSSLQLVALLSIS